MENQELPEQFQQDVLDAELTPDERMVAEEDMAEAIRAQQFAHEDPQPQVEPESNGQMIDDYTIRRAKDYGFTDQQIDSFGDPSALDASLTKMDQQVIEKLNSGNYVPAQDIPLQQEQTQDRRQLRAKCLLECNTTSTWTRPYRQTLKSTGTAVSTTKRTTPSIAPARTGQMQVNESFPSLMKRFPIWGVISIRYWVPLSKSVETKQEKHTQTLHNSGMSTCSLGR